MPPRAPLTQEMLAAFLPPPPPPPPLRRRPTPVQSPQRLPPPPPPAAPRPVDPGLALSPAQVLLGTAIAGGLLTLLSVIWLVAADGVSLLPVVTLAALAITWGNLTQLRSSPWSTGQVQAGTTALSVLAFVLGVIASSKLAAVGDGLLSGMAGPTIVVALALSVYGTFLFTLSRD